MPFQDAAVFGVKLLAASICDADRRAAGFSNVR
jgi:hypothetical protein